MKMTGLVVSVISCVMMMTISVRMCEAKQCQDSSDCPPQSPHCSDWGWCQWTDQYGTAGPTNIEEAGSCKQDEDCSPRFPVCSNLGFCTVKDYFEKSGIKRVSAKPQTGEERRKQFPVKNDIQSLNNVRKSLGRSSAIDREQNRNNPSDNQRQKLPFPPPIPPQNQQQHSSNLDSNSFVSKTRSRPVVPGILQDSELSNVADLASTITRGNSAPASDYHDRKSTDYYENYDYNYYTGFEVLRKDKQLDGTDKSIEHKIHGQFRNTQDQRTRDQRRQSHVSPTTSTNSDTFIYEEYEDNIDEDSESSPSTGGCLNDCVTDCVAIQQLTAYRDCVGFCGKTCKD